MRIPIFTAALCLLLLASTASAGRRHVQRERSAAESIDDLGEALGTVSRALRDLEGRLHLTLRQNPDVHELLRAVSHFEALAALAVPGFRIPIHVHPLPVLVARPTTGKLSSPFGVRRDPIRKRRRRFHKGLDFQGKRGEPVYAAGAGIVTRAERRGGYGRVVYIDHGLGLETRYAHLHRIHVKKGDFVAAGTRVGKVGSTGRSTGPHLHFEVRRHGSPVDPYQAMDVPLQGQDSGWMAAIGRFFSPEEKPRIAGHRLPKRPRSERLRALW